MKKYLEMSSAAIVIGALRIKAAKKHKTKLSAKSVLSTTKEQNYTSYQALTEVPTV